MKRHILILLCVLPFLAGSVQAQIVVQIGGTGTSSIVSHFYSYYSDLFAGTLVLASDMQANGAPAGGGKIRAIAYRVSYTYGPSNAPTYGMQWRMGHTQNTSTSVIIQSQDKELVATVDYTPVSGQWNYIYFDQSFQWNGTDNLWIESCYDDPTNASYTRTYGYVYANYVYPGANAQFQYGTNSTGSYCSYPAAGTIYYYNYMPDIRLEICNAEHTVSSFNAPGLVYLPNSVPIDWSVGRTAGSFTATVTFNLYTPAGQLVSTQQFQVPISGNTVTGTYNFPLMNIAPGYYKLEMVVNGLNECNEMGDYTYKQSVMLLNPGDIPCEVWPGDVNRDQIVNYGDRRDLNTYIHDAAMNPLWLNGPARYRADVDVNPLTYLEWEAQYSVPWSTPDGCHMDADGNGVVNNFDYIVIKTNWNRSTGAVNPKQDVAGSAAAFELEQNFPNPFNPSTTLRYQLPENGSVRLQVFDMYGREVTTLVNGAKDAGAHEVQFDAAELSSGQYLARINMSGFETGLTFSKTIRMTLSK